MKKTCTILLTGALLFGLYCARGQNGDTVRRKITVRGYLKDLQSFTLVRPADSSVSLNLLHNRLNLSRDIGRYWNLRLEIRNRIFWGNQVERIPGFGRLISRYNGLTDLSVLWVNKKNLVLHSVIDRAQVQYQDSKWLLRAGRQRINWGLHNVWNPNDLFNAWNFLDFDYEERPGNDALRVQYSFSGDRYGECAWKPGKNKEDHIAAFLYRFNRNQYDLQVLAGRWHEDWVVGGGWAGSVREAGFKGEWSYFHPARHFDDTAGTLSLSLMADQTFKKDWYLSFSFLFNSNPSGPDSQGGNPLLGSDLTAKQLFPFRYTFSAGAVKTFSPVSSFQTALIYSPTRHQLILFPAWSWNLSDNLDLDLTAQSFWAREQNRYRMQATSFFLRGKWSF